MTLFDCCLKCKAPKRYAGCHSSCEDYKNDKAILEERNKLIAEIKKQDYISRPHFSKTGQR